MAGLAECTPSAFMVTERLKRRRMHRAVVFILALIIISAVGYLTYAVFFSPAFRVKAIKISGESSISAGDIKLVIDSQLSGKNFGIISKKHMLFMNIPYLSAVLEDKFSDISSVLIERDWLGRNLNIEITERAPVAIYCGSNQPACFLMDKTGIIYENYEASTSAAGLIKIVDQSPRAVAIRARVMPDEVAGFIVVLNSELNSQIKISDFVLEPESLAANYVRIDTAEGWYILADTGQDPREVANDLSQLLAKEIQSNRVRLAYIDFRVVGRAYYKLRQ